jgi:hypothetical protein
MWTPQRRINLGGIEQRHIAARITETPGLQPMPCPKMAQPKQVFRPEDYRL